jgi:hypothetical protein
MVKLGERVMDRITKFEGIATARSEYLYGCVRILVEPTELKDGKPVEGQWFDEQRVDNESDVKTGGPGPTPTPRRDAPRG